MNPPKRKKRDWSEDGTWDTAVKASPAPPPATEERRTVSVSMDEAVAVAAAPVAAEGASTTIGPSIVVRGRLISHEDLVVHGRIEATLRSSRDLRLEASGIVLADVEVRSATISGTVVGSIKATERVELTAEARVVGDIDTPSLVVHDGARFRGDIVMAGLEGMARPAKKASNRTAAKPRPVAAAAAAVVVDPEPTPEPVVIPPSRPAPVVVPAPSMGPAASPVSPATPVDQAPARSRRQAAAEPESPAPSKRGWFSLG
ncbi:MAG: polymer-forming cytoskeletal protein [Myxococcota bacterium]